MTEQEHAELVKELEERWIGKYTPDGTKIVEVFVDYRQDHQEMNRVGDTFGNVYFIRDIEYENDDIKNMLLHIINNYGAEHQQRKLMDEVGELDRAITELEVMDNSGLFRESDISEARAHVAEEIGDVMNVVEEFMYYYKIDFNRVLESKHQKVRRQIGRMREENERLDRK